MTPSIYLHHTPTAERWISPTSRRKCWSCGSRVRRGIVLPHGPEDTMQSILLCCTCATWVGAVVAGRESSASDGSHRPPTWIPRDLRHVAEADWNVQQAGRSTGRSTILGGARGVMAGRGRR